MSSLSTAMGSSHEMLDAQNWNFPVPIIYGPGRISEIGSECVKLGIKNPLIVTDKGSSHLPYISVLETHLANAGVSCATYADVSPNPRDDEVGKGKHAFNSGLHDAVIAIGGGSAMDGGKLICLTANNELDLWAFDWEKPPAKIGLDQSFPKLITIPTTAGTGAETEGTAMVTNTKKAMKFCLCHPDLRPSLAILDPELTITLPKTLTAWTGVDALTHAIEAYLVPGFHPLCDGMALEGLSLISSCLPIVNNEPNNLEARGGMLVGSCLAGIAFSKGLGLVHAISHMIGAEFETQHGLTNAIVLPVVLRFNLPGMSNKVKRMSEAMGLENYCAEAFISNIEILLDEIDIPRSLSEINVPIDCAQRVSEKALQDSAAKTNPRPASSSEIEQLIRTAIIGAR